MAAAAARGAALLALLACLGCRPAAPRGCGACHRDAGAGGSHRSLPCEACHGGDSGGRRKEQAHRGLLPRPGALAQAAAGCRCHGAVVERVRASPMATSDGMAAVNRVVMGDGAEPHLAQLCGGCHLGAERPLRGVRSGCLACHEGPPATGAAHPTLTLQIGAERCQGCHSGTRRVATSYQGWHETELPPSAEGPGLRTLPDGRVFRAAAPDVHFSRGLACIDCHTPRELMGDGRRHAPAAAALEVGCADCHRREAPPTLGYQELDDESRRLLALRQVRDRAALRYVRAARSGLALYNVTLEARGIRVRLKGGGASLWPRPPAAACADPAHRRLTCQACHAAWAPQCLSCHVQREGEAFREYAGALLAEPPILGVRDGRIDVFTPGMVLTRDLTASAAPLAQRVAAAALRRRFAPLDPHTTAPRGRGCASCHESPLALGYGRGALRLQGPDPASWRFAPAYEALKDGLPADAWIGFLSDAPPRPEQAPGTRPLSRAEQERVLRAGQRRRAGAAGPER